MKYASNDLGLVSFLTRNVRDYEALLRLPFEGKLHIYLNPQNFKFYVESWSVLESCAYYRVDGFFVSKLLSWLLAGSVSFRRQSFDFTSLADSIFEKVRSEGALMFVSGGSLDEVKKFKSIIEGKYPGLKMCVLDGYVASHVRLKAIADLQPDVVVLGLGNMRQEREGLQIVRELELPVFTCGAFISQTARSNHTHGQYPTWVNKYHLRWSYRMMTEPHVIKRVLTKYPVFLIKIIRLKIARYQ